LENQVGVLSVVNLSLTNHIEREMALLHVKTTSPGDRNEVVKLAEIFEARVIDAARETVTVQAVAERERLKELLELLQAFGICEIARAGTLAIGKM
jgi:acetolactate synthase-1/3 small subunit